MVKTSLGERLLFTILLLIGGFMWTQVISRSTAIASSLNAHQLAHQQTMDDLNNIAERQLGSSTGPHHFSRQPCDKDTLILFLVHKRVLNGFCYVLLTCRSNSSAERLFTDIVYRPRLSLSFDMKVRLRKFFLRSTAQHEYQARARIIKDLLTPFAKIFKDHFSFTQ